MASYCLTVTRLRVRKRLFPLTEFLFARYEVHTRHQTGCNCSHSLRGFGLTSSGCRKSSHRAAFSQVTVSCFDSWLRRIVTAINNVPPDKRQHFFTVTAFRTGTVVVGINWTVVEKGPGFPGLCKVIARLRNSVDAHLMTVDSWPRRLMRSSVFLDQPEPDHIVYVYFEKHGPFCGDFFFFFKTKGCKSPKPGCF